MKTIRIPRYDNDTPVLLNCGCETIWHDGSTLAKNIYAWCEAHQDTSVKVIHARPTHYENWGGARKGAGRKRGPEPVEQHTVTFYRSHVKLLKSLDPNLSQAIRKLIARAG